MSGIVKLLLFFIFITTNVSICSAKEWKGIIPLKSTRSDVEQLLGTSENKGIFSTYYLTDENATIRYSRGECDDEWDVALDTVLYIIVYPKKKMSFADLILDLRKYKRIAGDFDVQDHFYYINDEEGLTLSVLGGKLESYIYKPTIKDACRRCPRNSD